jgi:hypothetical protein
LKRLFFLFLFLAVFPTAKAQAGAAAAEVRLVGREGVVLLSRQGQPLAAAQLRAAAEKPASEILSLERAREILQNAGAKDSVLKQGAEQVRDFEFPYPSSPGAAAGSLNVVLRVRQTAGGARLLASSELNGPAGESPPQVPRLELALQFFPNNNQPAAENEKAAQPELGVLTFIDGQRRQAPAGPLDLPGGGEFRARSFIYEAGKDFRVDAARSGPARWQARRLPAGLLLTAPLAAHPREPGILGSFVLYLGAGPDDAPPEISPVYLQAAQIPAHDFIEGALRVYASGANPFVLGELAVIAEVAFPPQANGEAPLKRLPCYFWEAPSWASAEGEFRFRFSPPHEGLYGLRVVVISATGELRGEALGLRATPANSAGPVRARKGERFFRQDDGSLFLPVCAQAEAGAGSAFFRAVARSGGNAVRLLSAPPLEPLQAGQYDADAAENLDLLFRAAQVRGIFLLLPIENGSALGKDSQKHPYFRELGGPLAATPEFFRNTAAKKLFQNRLTYLAARYSAYRSLLSWELVKGLDDCWQALKDDPDDKHLAPAEADLCRRARRDVQDWVNEMALHLKGMDQHGHPVCVSTGCGLEKPWSALESLENLDWIFTAARPPEYNAAQKDGGGAIEAINSCAKAARQPGRPHRPFMLDSFLPPARTQAAKEPADELWKHNVCFASLACGLAGTPVVPQPTAGAGGEYAPPALLAPTALFASALAEIASGEGRGELRCLDENLQTPAGALHLLGRVGRQGMAVWLCDESAAGAARETKDVQLSLPPLQEGAYTVAWLDTWRGILLRQDSFQAPAKRINEPLPPVTLLPCPVFKHDLAVIITRKQ